MNLVTWISENTMLVHGETGMEILCVFIQVIP
jgi:hypothetical protein